MPHSRLTLAIAVAALMPSLASAATAATPCTDTIITECRKEFPASEWPSINGLLRALCISSGIDACESV